jgi:GNAT superfamily N-acetyltransferase
MSPDMPSLRIEPAVSDTDRRWIAELWRAEWGGETMVSRGRLFHVDDVPGLIAWDEQDRAGAATYHVDGADCELTSINAVRSGRGVGTALLSAVEGAAQEAGANRVWLITTNDNMEALRFYQRRGYRLAALHLGTVDEARALKPSIPATGAHGIPIRDEIELEKRL